MELIIRKVLEKEIIHFYDGNTTISSSFNKVFIEKGQHCSVIQLPVKPWESIFGLLRITRRALRLDKCNVIPTQEGNCIIIYRGKVYFYDNQTQKLTLTLTLKQCRNVLHQSINAIPNGTIFFGEYGANPNREPVPVYRSVDGGRSWQIIYQFKEKEIKHVHGCYWDKYEQKVWTFTGDFENENWVIVSDEHFKEVERIGNGQQQFRCCNAFFEKDKVHWMMDSQLEKSYHIILDRKTRKIEKKELFPGPVWYIKKLNDGYYLAGTTQEIGAGVLDEYAHLMVSTDLTDWRTLYKFSHDGLPKRYFKFGVIGFADGKQSSEKFYIFTEALKGFDGKVIECCIKSN